MNKFKVLKQSFRSKARLGILETSHGKVETPTLVPVATQAVVKTLNSEEVLQTKTQILICNTFHLHLKPGEKVIKLSGGLHKFMNWQKPLMTDSGGFQVFSLGVGKDLKVGKIMKNNEPKLQMYLNNLNNTNNNSKNIKITSDGVLFRSPIDGKQIFLGPKESIKIQEDLGADIIFAFDECTSPTASYEYTKKSLERTHRWAIQCLKDFSHKSSVNSQQSLFGIVQGGRFKDLRKQSAKFISSLNFDGFGIGGEFGDDKNKMTEMINWVVEELPPEKPRHLLGIGHPNDILKIIKSGVDTFDCIAPTHYARRGIAFVSTGKLDMNKSKFLKDKKPLDKNCQCFVCQNYSRSYISHLFRAKEITGMKLLTFHNLYYFNSMIERIRQDIKKGKI